MIRIETIRLILRNFKKSDWKDMLELAIKFEASDVALYDHEWPTTEREIKRVVKNLSKGNDLLAVELKSEQKVIGLISMNKASSSKKASDTIKTGEIHNFGFNFNFDYHGKGFAFEAAQASLKYLFETMNVEKLETGTSEYNLPSQKLLEKLGFEMTSKGVMSFRKDEQGNPIEFPDRKYELCRSNYDRLHTKEIESSNSL